MGFVHFRGNVKIPTGATEGFMNMPPGYRNNETYVVPVWDSEKNIVGSMTMLSGSCFIGSGVSGSEFNGTIMHITYQGV